MPEDPRERALMFGLLRELVGECGLAWYRRLQLLPAGKDIPGMEALVHRLQKKYGYSEMENSIAEKQISKILRMLCDELKNQSERGSRYYVGHDLTALDIYSAVFSAVMLQPLPHEQIPMPRGMRKAYEKTYSLIQETLDPILLEHREYIFKKYLKLPMDF
ncbi:MAG: hypothetical protein JRC77_07875 [Deltaproteobacteria bacterium]|nr:hypothetical protein [Deltaproteobacteria bacterium]